MTIARAVNVLSISWVLLALHGAAQPAVAVERDLPVPAQTIYPNEIISEAKLVTRRFMTTDHSVLGYVTASAEIIGKQARRRLAAGKPILLSAFSEPVVIRRGALVTAAYNEDGFSISTTLVALQDGVAGDVIEARNGSSGIVIKAVVKPDGTLALDGAP